MVEAFHLEVAVSVSVSSRPRLFFGLETRDIFYKICRDRDQNLRPKQLFKKKKRSNFDLNFSLFSKNMSKYCEITLTKITFNCKSKKNQDK